MGSFENLSAAHATLLVGILLQCCVTLGWLLAAAMLPSMRSPALHWAGFAFLQGATFFSYLNSAQWPESPIHAVNNILLVGALLLQVRGLQRLAGRRPTHRVFMALLAFTCVLQGVWLASEHSAWRIASTSLLLSAISAWNAVTMLRCVHQEDPGASRLLRLLLSAPSLIGCALFALRALTVLQHPEWVIREARLERSIGMLGSLVWLFLSLSVALALVSVVLFKLQRQLSQAATHDALTGLPNRRAADAFMAQEALRAQRQGTPMSALMVDIDFFKKVNDQLGHAAGDHVLQTLARLLKERARATDMVARWGGEEFLVLLPNTPLTGAIELAEQLRLAVQNAPFFWQEHTVPITVSIGVATWSNGAFHANALVADADGALYHAKHSGRNCVRTRAAD